MRAVSPEKILGAAVLALGLACSGGKEAPAPKPPVVVPPSLAYADPTGPGWKLVKNTRLSTARHLVLDLAGPAGGSGYGVALTLDLGPDAAKAAWARVQAGDALPARSTVFNAGGAGEAFKAVATPTGALVAGTFQLGAIGTPTTYKDGQALLSIALDAADGVKAGDTILLSVTQSQELQAAGLRPIRVQLSPIQVQ